MGKTIKQIFKVYAVNQPFMDSKQYAAYKQMADETIASLEPLPVAPVLLTIGIAAPVGFIAYFVIRRRNGKGKKTEPINIPNPDGSRDEFGTLSSGKGFVTIFGGLQIVDETGKEHHDELSAKLSELLAISSGTHLRAKHAEKG